MADLPVVTVDRKTLVERLKMQLASRLLLRRYKAQEIYAMLDAYIAGEQSEVEQLIVELVTHATRDRVLLGMLCEPNIGEVIQFPHHTTHYAVELSGSLPKPVLTTLHAFLNEPKEVAVDA
jgi:hypothetical protein